MLAGGRICSFLYSYNATILFCCQTAYHEGMQRVDTFPGKTYSVHTANGCTVSDDSGWSKEIDAPDGYFTAHGSTVYLSDDEATLREVFKAAPAAGSIGGGGCVDGEKMIPLGDATELPMKHGVWYEYHGGDALTVVPAEWDYRIKTCYLLTTVHVQLNGVRWIDGEPVFSDEAAIYVFALQQIDHTRIAANLAYVYTLEN